MINDCTQFKPFSLGISLEEKGTLSKFIENHSKEWIITLTNTGQNFLYLKSRDIKHSCSLQVFKDGRIWVHSKEVLGKGRSKRIKAVYVWGTDQSYAKVSPLKKNRFGHVRSNSMMEKEIKYSLIFQGKRGVIQMITHFSLPSKSAPDNQKKVMITERYHRNLDNLIGFTAHDIHVIGLDLFLGILAYQDEGLISGDCHCGNMLVKYENGQVIKACFVDFEDISHSTSLDQDEKNGIIGLLENMCEQNQIDKSFLKPCRDNEETLISPPLEILIERLKHLLT